MELGEVVNPHYAFPIVCVVVCALLVFAFGFKSPGQPPSFDAVLEEERKSTKKRKGKDSQKSKLQQNGRPGGISASNKSDGSNQSNRGKQASEKHVVKSEPKNKKNRISQFKKAEVGIDAFVVSADDNNEGEWVQQLSKKERKNRKREEISGSLNIESEKPALPEVVDAHQNLIQEHSCDSQESSPKKKGKKQQKELESNKPSKNDTMTSKSNKTLPPEPEIKCETATKDLKTSKKKKQKDETKAVNDVHSIPVGICDNHETNENVTNSENYVTDLINTEIEKEEATQEFEQIEESVPKDDAKVQLKKKKGKKKNQDNFDISETVADGILDADEAKPVSSAEDDIVPENTAVPETLCTNMTDSSHTEIEDEKDTETVTQGDSNKNSQLGSNVVFDELGDMWQNARPQRKKKKARREQ